MSYENIIDRATNEQLRAELKRMRRRVTIANKKGATDTLAEMYREAVKLLTEELAKRAKEQTT